ncbi:Chloroperoxidase [Mycena maculata]|uniref:Chloroperoxidase n=1 Tax=Mycena maculata TaxID=230809 RepID=A0AAD7ILH7_9AGAR|nr:Chloroperoxidase [Mycena maculata]
MRVPLLASYLFILSSCASGWGTFPVLRSRHPASRAATEFELSGQLIDVTGPHEYMAATNDDLRGPCPGLNALANHGYIPRNGFVCLLDAFFVSQSVFGFAVDAASVVSALAGLYASDITELPCLPFSIGGPTPRTLLGIILGESVGLNGTHNQFETDTSPTRCDLYECGENSIVQPDILQNLLDLFAQNQPGGQNQMKADFDTVGQHHVNRIQHSIENNPYFFYGPVQMAVSCVVHLVIPGAMANHSASNPDGYISPEGLKSLYGVAPGPDGKLKYNWGTEQIPPNWYRRPLDAPYSPLLGLVDMWTNYPQTLIIGGNTNGINTFAPLDIGDFTNGVYSTAALLEGNNAACFVVQAVQVLIPSILENVEAILTNVLAKYTPNLACPELQGFKMALLEQYPGYMLKH